MEFELGQTYSGYKFLDVVGRSRSAVQYRVQNTLAQRVEGLRTLTSAAGDDPEAVERFLREVRIRARLSHPHIVTFYTAVPIEGRMAMTTELADSLSLAERLHLGPLPWQEALDITRQLLEALACIHQQSFVHRDVTPENILFGPGGFCKLAEFSLARPLEAAHNTEAGAVVGNPRYISPEQVKGERSLDQRSDLYSLGVVLYEMLCGRPPFESRSQFELMMAHVNLVPAPPSSLRANLPGFLDRVVLKALAKDAEDRYQSAADFADALDGTDAEVAGVVPTEPAIAVAAEVPELVTTPLPETVAEGAAVKAATAEAEPVIEPVIAAAEPEIVCAQEVIPEAVVVTAEEAEPEPTIELVIATAEPVIAEVVSEPVAVMTEEAESEPVTEPVIAEVVSEPVTVMTEEAEAEALTEPVIAEVVSEPVAVMTEEAEAEPVTKPILAAAEPVTAESVTLIVAQAEAEPVIAEVVPDAPAVMVREAEPEPVTVPEVAVTEAATAECTAPQLEIVSVMEEVAAPAPEQIAEAVEEPASEIVSELAVSSEPAIAGLTVEGVCPALVRELSPPLGADAVVATPAAAAPAPVTEAAPEAADVASTVAALASAWITEAAVEPVKVEALVAPSASMLAEGVRPELAPAAPAPLAAPAPATAVGAALPEPATWAEVGPCPALPSSVPAEDAAVTAVAAPDPLGQNLWAAADMVAEAVSPNAAPPVSVAPAPLPFVAAVRPALAPAPAPISPAVRETMPPFMTRLRRAPDHLQWAVFGGAAAFLGVIWVAIWLAVGR